MKARRVILTVEIETDDSVSDLKTWMKERLQNAGYVAQQVQANVIQGSTKPKPKPKRKR